MLFVVRVEAQPIDTTQPIVRISPALKNGPNIYDNFGFSISLYQLNVTDIKSWR